MTGLPARTANGATATGGEGQPPNSGGLECSGVNVHYGGLVALQGVELAVPPATIVGLVGPNGAGKSTLFGVLSGLVRPTTGKVLLDGAGSHERSPTTEGRARAGAHLPAP
jgi:ABC-type branched-subunit amino acid transport system ATPase component